VSDVSATGTVVGMTLVHTPAPRPAPWLAVLVDTADGLRHVGLGAAPLSVGDRVQLAGDEDGVPLFAPAGR
jgi:hypothetical protein